MDELSTLIRLGNKGNDKPQIWIIYHSVLLTLLYLASAYGTTIATSINRIYNVLNLVYNVMMLYGLGKMILLFIVSIHKFISTFYKIFENLIYFSFLISLWIQNCCIVTKRYVKDKKLWTKTIFIENVMALRTFF